MADSKPIPSTPGKRFTLMLLALRTEIKPEELDQIKFLLRMEKFISYNDTDEIKTTDDLLAKLKHGNILNENNVDELLRICEDAGIDKAAATLRDYKKTTDVKESPSSSKAEHVQQSVKRLKVDPSAHDCGPRGAFPLQSANVPPTPSTLAQGDSPDITKPVDMTQSSETRSRQTADTTEEYYKAKATFSNSLKKDEIESLLPYFPKITRAKRSQIESGYQLLEELEVCGHISESNFQPLVIALEKAGLATLAAPFRYKPCGQSSQTGRPIFDTNQLAQKLREWYISLVECLTIAPWLSDLHLDDFFVDLHVLETINKAFKMRSIKALESFLDILKLGGHRTIILGDAGVGKSTLSLKFVRDWANEVTYMKDIQLVLLLRLRFITSESQSFVEAVLACLPDGLVYNPKDVEEYIRKHPASVLIIMDGFDELPNHLQGTPFHADVLAIIRRDKFPLVKLQLTSRTSAMEKLGKHWKKIFQNVLEIKGFTREVAELFIKTKFFSDNDAVGSKVIEDLEAKGLFEYIGTRPLLLNIFCGSVKVNMSEGLPLVPDSFTGLFKDVVKSYEFHLEQKLLERKAEEEASLQEMKNMDIPKMMSNVGRIAWEGLLNGPVLFWKQEDFLKACDRDNFSLALKLGIIQSDSFRGTPQVTDARTRRITVEEMMTHKNSYVGFSHRLFQEFSAAIFISSISKGLLEEILHELRADSQLTSSLEFVFRFVCGLSPNHAPLILSLLQGDDMLVAHCVHEYIHSNGSSEGRDAAPLREAIASVSSLHVESKIEEKATMSLIKAASSNQIPLRLHLICDGRTPGYVRDVLGEAAPMVTSLEIYHNGVSAFSSSPPATGPFPQLTYLYVEECELADGPADSSAVWEDLLHCCLTHAPRLEHISFLGCENVPERIRESNVPLRKLLLSKEHVKVQSGHGYLDHATGRWSKLYSSSEEDDENSPSSEEDDEYPPITDEDEDHATVSEQKGRRWSW